MSLPVVTVETTAGNLVLELEADEVPQTVDNFLAYVRAGFYAGTVFHRVIPGFVAQAGGYLQSGDRKPPLRPPLKLEISKRLRHEDAALGMARLPSPDTATSEFYLCDGPQRDLDSRYAVFGRLLEGRDTLQRITSGPRRSDDWPLDPPIILRAYEGRPDPANPTPAFQPKTGGPVTSVDAATVRAAARKLRGRAALLRARRPMGAYADLEAAIARADRTARQEDLEAAERLLKEKEGK